MFLFIQSNSKQSLFALHLFQAKQTCDWLPCIWSAQHVYILKPKFAAESVDGFETTVPGISVGLPEDGDLG